MLGAVRTKVPGRAICWPPTVVRHHDVVLGEPEAPYWPSQDARKPSAIIRNSVQMPHGVDVNSIL